jgi:hypothetical protein
MALSGKDADLSQTTAWAPVPRQLTEAMREAFWNNMTRDIEDGIASAADKCWAEMLAAAPTVDAVLAYPGCPSAWRLKPEDLP